LLNRKQSMPFGLRALRVVRLPFDYNIMQSQYEMIKFIKSPS
jgi:hypothetical protein